MAKDTNYILKTSPIGGALPGTPDDLTKAVEYRHRLNSKAVEGKVKPKHAVPTLLGGETIILEGAGPLFDGLYIVETHTLSLSRSNGLSSVFKVLRNAVGGESTRGDDTIEDLAPTVEGSATSDEQVDPEPLNNTTFEQFQEISG